MSTRSTSFGCRIERIGFTTLGFCAAVGLLCLLKGTPVKAQPPGINLTALYNQVQALQGTVNAQASTIINLQSTLISQGAAIAVVQTKTQFQAADPVALSTTFSGCNVIVNDGSGSTARIVENAAGNGIGNLIVGYNALGNHFLGDVRTGSHNLILGDQNDYSSFGGLVAGEFNEISGPYSSVSGGLENTASGDYSSVSGGTSNTAAGTFSSVSGGAGNMANSEYSSVSGGEGLIQNDTFGWSGGSYHSP